MFAPLLRRNTRAPHASHPGSAQHEGVTLLLYIICGAVSTLQDTGRQGYLWGRGNCGAGRIVSLRRTGWYIDEGFPLFCDAVYKLQGGQKQEDMGQDRWKTVYGLGNLISL